MTSVQSNTTNTQ